METIRGVMRVPKVRKLVADALEGKVTLGIHLNSDKSMALGEAFREANVSTSFKFRHVGMTYINSFLVAVDLTARAAAEVGGGMSDSIFSYQTTVSRAKFEEICYDVLLRAAEPVARAL